MKHELLLHDGLDRVAALLLPAILLFCAVFSPATALARTGASSGGTMGVQQVGNQTVRVHVFSAPDSCLRVVTAGVRTRNADPSPPVASGTIVVPPGPAPGNIIWAGLYWEILTDTPGGPFYPVTLNGALVTPELLPLTGDPCWPEFYSCCFFADVTDAVFAVAAGPNVVFGLSDSGILGHAPESEGASLVVIYQSDDVGACEIIVKDGNNLVDECLEAWDESFPVTCEEGSPARLYFIGGDGQTGPTYPDYLDNQFWNFVALGDGDDWDASDPGAPGAAADLGWDTDGWSVVVGPPATASVSSFCLDGTDDCFNWVATVLAVGGATCIPTPIEESTWGRVKSLYRDRGR